MLRPSVFPTKLLELVGDFWILLGARAFLRVLCAVKQWEPWPEESFCRSRIADKGEWPGGRPCFARRDVLLCLRRVLQIFSFVFAGREHRGGCYGFFRMVHVIFFENFIVLTIIYIRVEGWCWYVGGLTDFVLILLLSLLKSPRFVMCNAGLVIC